MIKLINMFNKSLVYLLVIGYTKASISTISSNLPFGFEVKNTQTKTIITIFSYEQISEENKIFSLIILNIFNYPMPKNNIENITLLDSNRLIVNENIRAENKNQSNALNTIKEQEASLGAATKQETSKTKPLSTAQGVSLASAAAAISSSNAQIAPATKQETSSVTKSSSIQEIMQEHNIKSKIEALNNEDIKIRIKKIQLKDLQKESIKIFIEAIHNDKLLFLNLVLKILETNKNIDLRIIKEIYPKIYIDIQDFNEQDIEILAQNLVQIYNNKQFAAQMNKSLEDHVKLIVKFIKESEHDPYINMNSEALLAVAEFFADQIKRDLVISYNISHERTSKINDDKIISNFMFFLSNDNLILQKQIKSIIDILNFVIGNYIICSIANQRIGYEKITYANEEIEYKVDPKFKFNSNEHYLSIDFLDKNSVELLSLADIKANVVSSATNSVAQSLGLSITSRRKV